MENTEFVRRAANRGTIYARPETPINMRKNPPLPHPPYRLQPRTPFNFQKIPSSEIYAQNNVCTTRFGCNGKDTRDAPRCDDNVLFFLCVYSIDFNGVR